MTPDEISRERARFEYAARSNEVVLRVENQIKKLDTLFRNLVLINGGAIVALFTLLGNSDKAHLNLSVGLLWWAFTCFAGGTASSVLASGLSALSQYHLSIRAKRQAWNEQAAMFGLPPEHDSSIPFKRSQRYIYLMWVASASGLAAFVIGAASAMSAVLP